MPIPIAAAEAEQSTQARVELETASVEYQRIIRAENPVFAIHSDADGLAGLALTLKARRKEGLEQVPPENIFTVNNSRRELEKDQLEQIKGTDNCDALTFIDLNPRNSEQMKNLNAKGRVIANVDHHNFKPEHREQVDLFINAKEDKYQSLQETELRTTAELVSKLTGDLPENKWLVDVANHGDAIEGDYPEEIVEISKILNYVGLATKRGENATTRDELLRPFVQLLIESNSVEEFFKNFNESEQYSQIRARYNIIRDLISKHIVVLKKASDLAEEVEAEGEGFKERTTGTEVKQLPEGETIKEAHFDGGIVLKKFKNGEHVQSLILYQYPRAEYELIEQILKSHFTEIGGKTTVILIETDARSGTLETDIRVYTSDPEGPSYAKIAEKYGGGGHRERAGTTIAKVKKIETFLEAKRLVQEVRDYYQI